MSIFSTNRIPTLMGLVLVSFGLVLGVVLINSKQIFRLRAKEEVVPKNVRVSNITDSSFNISWTTEFETKGLVKWGEKEKSLSSIAQDFNVPNTKTKNHYFKLENLSEGKRYYFEVNSEGINYTNNGLPWQIQTGSKLPPPSTSNIIYGSILNPSGQPEEKVIVYVSAGGGSPLSTITQKGGTWTIPLSSTRTKNLNSYISIDDSKTIVEIIAQSGSLISVATIYPIAAKPAPQIILGQTYDFKNLTTEGLGNTPEANIEISRSTNITITPSLTPSEQVTINNPEEDGVVTSSSLEFSGKGPPGETIRILIESEDTVSTSIEADSSGNWNFSPPQELKQGEHEVTLTWEDENGISRNIKRKFTVNAQNLPTAPLSTSPETTPEAKSILNLSFLGLTGINLILAISAVVILIVIIGLLVARRKKGTKAIKTEEISKEVVGTETPKNNIVGSGAKILLLLGVLILLAAGGFSLYQLYKSKITKEEAAPEIAQIIEPSPIILLTVSPTPTIFQALVTTPTTPATRIVSPTPSLAPTPTVKPTVTPTLKPTVSPSPSPRPTMVQAIPTTVASLPSAGVGTPTLIGVISGIGLIIFSFALLF